MSEYQTDLIFASDAAPAPAPLSSLRDEIARAWGLPLGARVQIGFHPAFPVANAAGILELRSAPGFPRDPRQPLALRVAGCDFTSRDIAHWTLA